MVKSIIIIGASGHGKVIADIIMKSGDQVIGFLDDNPYKKEILGFPVLGKIEIIDEYKSNYFIIAIGDNQTRKRIVETYPNLNYYRAIHPTAVIGMDVQIEKGTCVMANAVINSSTKIGEHCIINTGAIVEHDNEIADCVHISPNTTLGGTVKIGELTHVGIGSIIKNNINIEDKCIIGAGSVVVKNLKEMGTYVGTPAKKIGLQKKI